MLGPARPGRAACRSAPSPRASRTTPAASSPTSAWSAEDDHGRTRHHHLPRRPRRDRPQLHGPRVRRPAPAPRLRAHVPRARAPRRRPHPPRLHLAAREGRPGHRLHRHPRPRGPRRRPVVPAPRAVVPDLRVRPHARAGQEPHRGGRACSATPTSSPSATASVARSARSTSSSSPSPTRCPTGSPPRSTRRRACIMHTGDWKLDLTPVDGRLTDLARMGAIAVRPGRPPAHGRLHQRRRPRPHAGREKSVGAVLYDLFHEHEGRRIVIACFASHVHRVQQIADAAIGLRPQGRHPRAVDEEEHAAGPGDGPAAASRSRRIIDIEDIDRPARRRRVRDLHRQPGRADVGPHPHGQQREPLAHHRRGRHGDPLLAPHPGQRDERDAR